MSKKSKKSVVKNAEWIGFTQPKTSITYHRVDILNMQDVLKNEKRGRKLNEAKING